MMCLTPVFLEAAGVVPICKGNSRCTLYLPLPATAARQDAASIGAIGKLRFICCSQFIYYWHLLISSYKLVSNLII